MAKGRHYRVRVVAPQVDNIHLRIASDVYLFIQRTLELATGLLGSTVALVSFAYILWGLSATTPVPGMGGGTIPGWLIWAALLYAGLGTLFAHMIIMDSDSETAMTLGRTYLTTDAAPRSLSRLDLDLIVQ